VTRVKIHSERNFLIVTGKYTNIVRSKILSERNSLTVTGKHT
jgi:hypothetical protein